MRFSRNLMPWAAALVASLLGAACSCGGGQTTGQVAAFLPALEKDPSKEADYIVDFGVVALGDRKSQRVEIKNGGNTTLVVSGEKVERPFGHDLPRAGLQIGVGASAYLDFSFEPQQENPEPIQQIIELFTNERDGKSYTVRMLGQGRRATLRCEPAAIDFGPVPRGSTRELSANCTNELPISVEASASRFKGNYAQFFTAELEGALDGWVDIPAGGSIRVTLKFTAQSIGKNDAVLELVDAAHQPLATIQAEGLVVQSTVRVEPDGCLDFSYVAVGESATKAFELQNIGTDPVRIVKVVIPDASQADFSQITSTPIELPADGSSHGLSIAFHPSNNGPYHVPIELHTDDPRPDAQVVGTCVKGFGGGPSISCTRESLDFGMVAVGMPVKMRYSCVNDGAEVPGSSIDPLVIDAVISTAEEFSATIINDDETTGPKRGGYRTEESFLVEVVYSPTAERFDAGEIRLETRSAPEGAMVTSVSGQGRDLPPCDFSVEPQLRFGIVDRGESLTQTFGIRNNLDSSCLINELQLAEGTPSAFSVEPIRSIELHGGETLKVPVTFAPREYRDLFLGAVEFQISNPDEMHQRVELRGSSLKPCLHIDPKSLDFGALSPGCQSREQWISVSNTCGVPMTVRSVEINETADAGSFLIKQRSPLPRTLHPNERLEVTVVFIPEEEGEFSGSLLVEVDGSEPYLSTLIGEAVPNPIQTDAFDQRARPKVDILWVMDNSGSFNTYQDRVAENLPSFLAAANRHHVDYHIAVTTSGLTPSGGCPGGASGGEDGRFFPVDGSTPRILTPTTPDLEAHWAHNMRVGTCHSVEQYFEAAYRALSPPLINETKSSKHNSPYNDGNAGFLRREASLSIIFVADEPEQSTVFNKSPMDYLAFYQSLKGHNMFRAHAISGGSAKYPSTCMNNGERFLELVEATEGTWIDICTPKNDTEAWAEGLESMSEGAFGFLARFVLRGNPADINGDGRVTEADIELYVDGYRQPPISSGNQRWTYDPLANAIDFTPLYVPKPGSQITATYRVACGER